MRHRRAFQFVLLLTVLTLAVLIAVLSMVRPVNAQATDTPTPTSTATATPEAYLTINQSLISCWTMDEQSGTRADSAGSNSLTDNNTVGYTAGKFGNAASFVSDNSEYLSKSSNESLKVNDVDASWAAWFYPGINGIALFFRSNSYYALWRVNNYFRFGYSAEVSISMTASIWYYVISWYDAENNQINAQIDGGTPVSNSYTITSPGEYEFDVGKNFSNYSTGYVDELAFWKKELSEFERAWLYESGTGKSCDQIIHPPTPTPTPTLTPTPGGERVVMLSSGDWVTVDRRIDYGQIAVVGTLALVAIIILVTAIIHFGEKWFN
jgi:hypothetical protein